MNHQEIQELIAAYAVHALDEHESATVEQHVESCESCRAELDQFRVTAAALGADIAAPPEAVWRRIESSLNDSKNTRSGDGSHVFPLAVTRQRRSTARWPAYAIPIAAAVAVLMIGLGAIATLNDDGSSESQLAEAAERAISAPGAQQMTMRSADGSLQANAVLLPSGNGYVTNVNLPEPPEGRTYQLWVILGDTPVSAGLLGRSPGTSTFAAPNGASGIAITEEAEVGSVAPTTKPVVSSLA